MACILRGGLAADAGARALQTCMEMTLPKEAEVELKQPAVARRLRGTPNHLSYGCWPGVAVPAAPSHDVYGQHRAV